MDSGKWIRELREERFVKSSDIERISLVDRRHQVADFTFHSTLADIETVRPQHQAFSLAASLKVRSRNLAGFRI
jgi:hypothetical protein